MRRFMQHMARNCTVCEEDASFWMELGDLTVYLCHRHEALCAQCLVVVDEDIAHGGNICASCLQQFPGTYAETADYECHEGCPECRG